MKTTPALGMARSFLAGRIPGQVVIQYTDRCNARCPQCGMRVTERFERSTLGLDRARKIIDHAADMGFQALSLTGGEPFLAQDEVVALLKHAARAGIPCLRTGTNGFMFAGHDKPGFIGKVERLAERLAATGLRNFWISLDSADPDVHEAARGLPGVVKGIEKAVPVFHRHGLHPTANLGINLNTGGDHRILFPKGRPLLPDEFRSLFVRAFTRFYSLAESLGFTIVNCCYPMSLEATTADRDAVYAATSADRIVRFSREEKVAMLTALMETIPAFRHRLRIFTPMSSLHALVRQHSGQHSGQHAASLNSHYPCRGGIDFFFVDCKDGHAYPCGYRGAESLGAFREIEPRRIPKAPACDACDWECFRDPSELFGPLLGLLRQPLKTATRLLHDPAYTRHWLRDLRYYHACNYFDGRLPPDPARLAAFAP